ncbi:MAG: hypothetical protein RBU29_07540 [bacterium]|jgi:hypothetical protein|nr:hypothetical protein [bacterium]
MRQWIWIGLVIFGCFLYTSGAMAQAPVAVADFEDDENGWWAEEHAHDLFWIDETAGPASLGAIITGIDPARPADDTPESKINGYIPEGINLADYEYLSFYYKCDNPAYTGGTMFVMPMTDGSAAGAGASHTGTMIGDDQWHYQEYHRSEFINWWGSWSWETSKILCIGVWDTIERGPCIMWYDHIMLFNKPGDGILLSPGGTPQVVYTNPSADAELSTLDQITILFDQEVRGVKAGDLLVQGKPATEFTTEDNRRFVFTGFPAPTFPDVTEPRIEPVPLRLQAGSIQSLDGAAFGGFSFSVQLYVHVNLPPVAFADFEDDTSGWWAEEHAYDLFWTDETPGPASQGAIMTGVDPARPADDSPESKVQGTLPEGINMAGYQYISFYYKCDNPDYTGNTMFVMPMTTGWSSGAGASHEGSMIADGEWHYEEFHRSEFSNWWGTWKWETTYYLCIGIWNTTERGICTMWYDHVMLFNNPGEGRLAGTPVPDWSLYAE